MWKTVSNLTEHGIIRDVPAHELPINAWSDGENIRFNKRRVARTLGHSDGQTPSVPPYFLLSGKSSVATEWWIYCGLAAVYSMIDTTHTNITRVSSTTTVIPYNATADNVWTGGVLNNQAILNSGYDRPQKWESVGGKLQNLTNWPSTYTAAVVRPHKTFLVALDVTENETRFPQMVKWSDECVAGSIDPSWDITDASLLAGEYILSESQDFCIDCLSLGDINIVYKQNSMWGMQFIGAPLVFRFFNISNTSGILARNCAVLVEGSHVVLTRDDIVIHAGGEVKSLLTERDRDEIFNSINQSYYFRSFVFADYGRTEVWFCIPTTGTIPDIAWIWNWRNNTWTKRDLPNIQSAAFGPVANTTTGDSWASDAGAWDADSTLWGSEGAAVPSQMLMAEPGNTLLHVGNSTNLFLASTFTAFVERAGIDFGNQDSVKLVRAVRPHFEADAGTVITIKIGFQMKLGDAITYSDPVSFTVGTDTDAYFLVTGRYITVRFESTANNYWELIDYALDVEEVSGW